MHQDQDQVLEKIQKYVTKKYENVTVEIKYQEVLNNIMDITEKRMNESEKIFEKITKNAIQRDKEMEFFQGERGGNDKWIIV